MLISAVVCVEGAVKYAHLDPDEILVYKTVGSTELTLHVFNPDGHTSADQCPAIVLFFGGGWKAGSPTQLYPQCKYLASRGMVAIAADYRVELKNQTTPRECVRDGKSAVRWVRQHSKDLGVDPNRIAAGGASAGGHVAAAAGVVSGFEEQGSNLEVSSRPDALVLFNPVFDNGPFGYGHDRVKEYWEEFSPMHNIHAGAPPTIVFFGTEDIFVPEKTARKYKCLMERVGSRCELYLYEGQPHGFFNYIKSKEYFAKTLNEADRFLVSLGYLDGNPSAQDFFVEILAPAAAPREQWFLAIDQNHDGKASLEEWIDKNRAEALRRGWKFKKYRCIAGFEGRDLNQDRFVDLEEFLKTR